MATNKKKPMKKKSAAKPAKKKATPAKVKAKTKAPIKAKAKTPTKPMAAKSVNWARIISPLNDRLVVTIEVAEEKTSGGIIIPGSAAQQPTRGKVLAVGPGGRSKKGKLRPPDVRVGDEVIYAESSGTKLSVKDQEFLILREEDVLGILTN